MTTVKETYEWCQRHGFFPVVLHPRSKASVSRNYVEPNYQAPPAGAFFPDKNIGVVLGPARKGPIDVDIDCPEAAFFAPYFLPKTNAVFGRPSKPRSHYLYIVKDATPTVQITDKSVNGDKKTIIEMRADAATAVQTVLPGSVHECGESVEWVNALHDPALVSAEELSRAVKRVAAAVVVTRHFWGPGCRHAAVMPIAGMMQRSGWTLDEAETFITAVMEYHGDAEKSRLPTVRTTFKKAEAGHKITGATNLKETFGDESGVNQLRSLLRDVDDVLGDVLAVFDERFAVVDDGRTRVAHMNDVLTVPGKYRRIRDVDDFYRWASDPMNVVDEKGKIRKVHPAKLWFERAQRNQIAFLPGVEECDVINEWTGWAVRPIKGEFPAFEELLRGLTNKTNTYDAVMTFLANVIREPMRKTKTILVFIGRQNAGKTLLFTYVGRMLGDFMVTASHPEQITGRFNDHLALSLLLVSEEAVFAGNHQHMNKLKDISGRSTMQRETKGGMCRPAPDYNRVVMLSNDHHAAPIESGDTRYIVIETADFTCSPELTARVVKEMNGAGPAALLNHFLHDFDYDLDKILEAKRRMKDSKAVASMKRSTGSTAQTWWEQTLMNGQLLDYDVWSMQKPNDARWPHVFARRAVYYAYAKYCKDNNNGSRTVPEGTFWAEMERMTKNALKPTNASFPVPNSFLLEIPDWIKNIAIQGTTSKRRQATAVLNFPTLIECRKAFEEFTGNDYEWPEVEDEPVVYEEKMEY